MVERLETRQLLSTITWENAGTNNNDADGFSAAYGKAANLARNIVKQAIADWSTVIVNFGENATALTDLGVPPVFPVWISATSGVTIQGGAQHAVGNVPNRVGAYWDPLFGHAQITFDQTAGGMGWFFDPNYANDSAFPKVIDAYSRAGSNTKRDLFSVALQQLGSVLGLLAFDTSSFPSDDLLRSAIPSGTRRYISQTDVNLLSGTYGYAVQSATAVLDDDLTASQGTFPDRIELSWTDDDHLTEQYGIVRRGSDGSEVWTDTGYTFSDGLVFFDDTGTNENLILGPNTSLEKGVTYNYALEDFYGPGQAITPRGSAAQGSLSNLTASNGVFGDHIALSWVVDPNTSTIEGDPYGLDRKGSDGSDLWIDPLRTNPKSYLVGNTIYFNDYGSGAGLKRGVTYDYTLFDYSGPRQWHFPGGCAAQGSITNLTASSGTFSDHILLSWADDPKTSTIKGDPYGLDRRGSDGSDVWIDPTRTNPNFRTVGHTIYFNDYGSGSSLKRGVKYTYTLFDYYGPDEWYFPGGYVADGALRA
jgi:hypothetical protein